MGCKSSQLFFHDKKNQNADTLDEAPMAYKSLADIIDVIRDSVEIIDIMKPVYNFKASDSEVPWKKRGDTNERKDTGAAS